MKKNQSVPSMLLKNFRRNRFKNLELSDIVSKVVEFSCDERGHIFVQQQLDNATNARKNALFQEILARLDVVAINHFGNYVVQKFLDNGAPEHKKIIIEFVAHNCVILCFDKYGSRVVQKAFKIATLEQQSHILAAIQGNVFHCAQNFNANHVLQAAFQSALQRETLNFIVNESMGNVLQMSQNPHASRLLQKVIKHGTEVQKNCIIREVQENLNAMVNHHHANYVVRLTLDFCKPIDRRLIMSEIFLQILPLSREQISSNVVEKCLSVADIAERHEVANHIIGLSQEHLWDLCINLYANYIVQKILEYATPCQREILFEKLWTGYDQLSLYACGRRITELIELYELNNNINVNNNN